MTLLSISNAKARPEGGMPLFRLGYRPFFLGAALFAVAAIALWMAVYVFRFPVPINALSVSQWHAHEMIYGYSLAVIAGFLLTAVRNWTNIQTPRGPKLAGLFALWAGARLLFFFGTRHIAAAAALDLLFIAFLIVSVLAPIVRSRQWRQMAIVSKLVLLGAGHAAFYLGVWGKPAEGTYWGLYGGLFLVIGLILTMGARVIPGFIRNGVGAPVSVENRAWVGASSLVLYLVFFASEVFVRNETLTSVAAAGLFLVTSVRLAGWHTPGIWRKPLLWSLFLAIAFIDLGFLLFAIRPGLGLTRFIPVHAMAFGGIGLVTLGMMARVALGHSGRNVNAPPKAVAWACAALALGAATRVSLPVIDAPRYTLWIGVSQACWIVAFLLFTFAYGPVLTSPDLRRREASPFSGE